MSSEKIIIQNDNSQYELLRLELVSGNGKSSSQTNNLRQFFYSLTPQQQSELYKYAKQELNIAREPETFVIKSSIPSHEILRLERLSHPPQTFSRNFDLKIFFNSLSPGNKLQMLELAYEYFSKSKLGLFGKLIQPFVDIFYRFVTK